MSERGNMSSPDNDCAGKYGKGKKRTNEESLNRYHRQVL